MPRRPTTTEFVRPREAATGDINGEQFVLNPNEIFDADHPIVRKHPGLFMPVEPTRHRPTVEQATAAPGELR
jgi:hypothetical protein